MDNTKNIFHKIKGFFVRKAKTPASDETNTDTTAIGESEETKEKNTAEITANKVEDTTDATENAEATEASTTSTDKDSSTSPNKDFLGKIKQFILSKKKLFKASKEEVDTASNQKLKINNLSFLATQLTKAKSYFFIIIAVIAVNISLVISLVFINIYKDYKLNIYITDRFGNTYQQKESETRLIDYSNYVTANQIAKFAEYINYYEAPYANYHESYNSVKSNVDNFYLIKLLSNGSDAETGTFQAILKDRSYRSSSDARFTSGFDRVTAEVLEVVPDLDTDDINLLNQGTSIYQILQLYAQSNIYLRFNLTIKLIFSIRTNINDTPLYVEYPPFYFKASVMVGLLPTDNYRPPTDIPNSISLDLFNPLRLQIKDYTITTNETREPLDIGYKENKSWETIKQEYKNAIINLKAQSVTDQLTE